MLVIFTFIMTILLFNCTSPTTNPSINPNPDTLDSLLGQWYFIHSFTENGTSWNGHNIEFRESGIYIWGSKSGLFVLDSTYLYLDDRYEYILNHNLRLKYGQGYYYLFERDTLEI